MNYEQARQRKSDGRWDWTNLNDGFTYRTGYCAAFKPMAEICASIGMPVNPDKAARHDRFATKYHTDGHATREEAERCHYEYVLDNELREFQVGEDTQHKCEMPNCPNWTQAGMFVGNWETHMLCDEHRNRAGIESVHPFEPNVSEIHS